MPRRKRISELEELRNKLPLDKKKGRQTLKKYVAYDFNKDLYYINVGRAEGEKSVRYKSFKSPFAAEKFLAERVRAEKENKKTAAILTQETVGQHFTHWLRTRKFESESNRIFYSNTINKHIVPALGNIELFDLTPDDIDDYVELKLKTLAPRTVRKHQDILQMGLKRAVLARKIDFNPMDAVEKVKAKKPIPNAYTLEEIQKILDVCRESDCMYGRISILAVFTGCRRGELLGLTWEDVYLDAPTPYIAIRRSRGDTNKGTETGDTKTRRGRRTIALVPELVELLKRMKQEYDANIEYMQGDFADDRFVICYPDGTLPMPSSISRGHSKLLKRAKVPRVLRFHDLRHTFATILKLTGATPLEIQDILGHEHFSTTEESYFADRTEVIETPLLKLGQLIKSK